MERIIGVIAKLSHSLGEMEEQAKEYFDLKDLTLTQMHYLEVISQLGNPNITELASALQLSYAMSKVTPRAWPTALSCAVILSTIWFRDASST